MKSSLCSSNGVQILLSICASMRWFLTKIEETSIIFQSGVVERGFLMITPQKYTKKYYLLFSVALYRFVNANSIWKFQANWRSSNYLISRLFVAAFWWSWNVLYLQTSWLNSWFTRREVCNLLLYFILGNLGIMYQRMCTGSCFH